MPDAPPASAVPSRSVPDRPTDETIKETFESVIIAFILAFVFRAYIVEAFVIPTGSMAPTLLGQHLHVVCQQCGYAFDADPPGASDVARPLEYRTNAICPMCLYPNTIEARTIPSAGDRILVHKYIYSVIDPTRWDVVVFKNPQNPDENFIKRLIGLPNEKIWIIEGNIYVKPASPADAPWRIARKSDARQGELVQRAVWQPVYHSDYVPLDDGKPSLNRTIAIAYRRVDCSWRVPWIDDARNAGPTPGTTHWHFADANDHPLTSYRHDTAEPGQIHFDFSTTLQGVGQARWYPYNQFSQLIDGQAIPSNLYVPDPVEDVRISADFLPTQAGLSVTLQTTARLDDPNPEAGPVPLRGRIDSQGHAYLEAINPDGSVRVLARADGKPFYPGVARRVELWFANQEASLWVSGRRILDRRFDLPIETVVDRPPLTQRPSISIHVEGSPVTLHHVELDRDLYYTVAPIGNALIPGRGALLKVGLKHEGQPVTLGPDDFFCMGDNSPRSSDGRAWLQDNPWIVDRLFGGDDKRQGIVPRKLMMGRAFFVYFPAMYSWDPKHTGIFPDFGSVRFIH